MYQEVNVIGVNGVGRFRSNSEAIAFASFGSLLASVFAKGSDRLIDAGLFNTGQTTKWRLAMLLNCLGRRMALAYLSQWRLEVQPVQSALPRISSIPITVLNTRLNWWPLFHRPASGNAHSSVYFPFVTSLFYIAMKSPHSIHVPGQCQMHLIPTANALMFLTPFIPYCFDTPLFLIQSTSAVV